MVASVSFRPCYILLTIFLLPMTIAKAIPMPAVNIPLGDHERGIKSITEGTNHVANLTRQHEGDVFIANGLSSCNMDTCVGLSSGTAGLSTIDTRRAATSSKQTNFKRSGVCECRCLPYLNSYREDLGICVDDIHECTLSPFISGSSSEKIPFVFLPLRGQIIYPSREISFPDVRTPICAVTSSQYLTPTGWSDLRNPIDTDFPFRLFRDEGRTFLQWLGEPDLRHKMQGRLILVHLMCRDMTPPSVLNKTNIKGSSKNSSKNIFTPCVAFRVNGSPVQYIHNVSEVLFQAEATSNLEMPSEGLTTREYVVIGVCSFLLGLIYVTSVFLYLHVKKRKMNANEGTSSTIERNNDYPKNDQVTFGIPFSRAGSIYSATSALDARNSQKSNRNGITREDIGIIKNNPLLKHFPNLNDHHTGFTNDLSNSNSECEENQSGSIDRGKNMQASVIIHPSMIGHKCDLDRNQLLESHSPTQENERLPEANVSIVEDINNDDKLENMRAIVNGTVRKKLYFNPAYFEPHLLLSPPPAAIEFLTKIREVIAIAKFKMASKRYQPSLNVIPEEGNSNDYQLYQKLFQNRHMELINRLECSGCPGCANNHSCASVSKCKNCGEKRNSIQKWLDSVSMHEENPAKNIKHDEAKSVKNKDEGQDHSINSNENLEHRNYEMKSFTRKLYTNPSTTPKIISQFLKSNNNLTERISEIEESPSKQTLPPHIDAKIILNPNGIYTFTETGSDIYNNPKFNPYDSPPLSQRSKTSSSRNRASKKRIEVLDQYANPDSEKNRSEILKSIKHMPDMVYEALAKDYSRGNFNMKKSFNQVLDIPTPDYDGSMDKKGKDLYNRFQNHDPNVPTPDYSTLSKKSLRHCQPDSPICRRRSPQYLIVDYETDSLERTTPKKKCNTSPTSSSDGNSQPSPSLSTALPLEEEVEIHHTVYDKVEGYRKDGDVIVKKRIGVSGDYEDIKMGSKKHIVATPRIKYDTPFRGSMTIEVEHEPQSDVDVSTDSDQFEPDTLDRKPKKHSFCDIKSSNAWTNHLNKSMNFVNNHDYQSDHPSLENMNSLPDFSRDDHIQNVVFRSSNSFRNDCNRSHSSIPDIRREDLHIKPTITTFGSLREIYQSKNGKPIIERPKLTNGDFEDKGRLLTLEAKHTKRQRKIIDDINKKLMPPDVVPSENDLYDIPKYPVKVNEINQKNSSGWNNDDFSDGDTLEQKKPPEDTDTMSNTSESTEITGVSDTQANSEFEYDSRKSKKQNNNSSSNMIEHNRKVYSAINLTKVNNINQIELQQNSIKTNPIYQEVNISNTNKDPLYESSPKMFENKLNSEDPDKIEVLSTRSLSVRSIKLGNSNGNEPNELNSTNEMPLNDVRNVQSVYRVEIPSPTNGMQIALGLKDRAKKSKDLKNAWKKFVSMATSKFSNGNNGNSTQQFNPYESKMKMIDIIDRDEGISSLIDYTSKGTDFNYPPQSMEIKRLNSGNLGNIRSHHQQQYVDHRFVRNELDSGYISADSSEHYNKRVYERYNFRSMSKEDHIIKIDTIEDNSDGMEGSNDDHLTRKVNVDVLGKVYNNNPEHQNMCNFDLDRPIEVNVYSSDDDDEPYLSACASSDSDDEGNTEDLCESGAESVETHSVFFKNIRKII